MCFLFPEERGWVAFKSIDVIIQPELSSLVTTTTITAVKSFGNDLFVFGFEISNKHNNFIEHMIDALGDLFVSSSIRVVPTEFMSTAFPQL